MYDLAITPIAIKETDPYLLNDHVPILEHRGSYRSCIGTIGIIRQIASQTDSMIVECVTCGSTDVMIYHARPPKAAAKPR